MRRRSYASLFTIEQESSAEDTLEQNLGGAVRSRALDVHIARLRKKLGPGGQPDRTVVKFGYRYVEPAS